MEVIRIVGYPLDKRNHSILTELSRRTLGDEKLVEWKEDI